MLEAYSTFAALAVVTERIGLSTLVTGNTYRNPALSAKTVTTLDVISGGRAMLGIGAGWFELEHCAYGFEFGTFTERFARLEEGAGHYLADAARRMAHHAPAEHGRHQRDSPPGYATRCWIGCSSARRTRWPNSSGPERWRTA